MILLQELCDCQAPLNLDFSATMSASATPENTEYKAPRPCRWKTLLQSCLLPVSGHVCEAFERCVADTQTMSECQMQ